MRVLPLQHSGGRRNSRHSGAEFCLTWVFLDLIPGDLINKALGYYSHKFHLQSHPALLSETHGKANCFNSFSTLHAGMMAI